MSGTTEMNFLFPVRDKGAWVRDCALDERKFQFGKQEGERTPLFIFHQLPLFNDDTGRPPHRRGTPDPRTLQPPRPLQHTLTHTNARPFTHRDGTWHAWHIVPFLVGISERGCYMGRHSSSSVWAPLFFAVCVSSVSRLCTQGSSSLQSRFSSSIMCIMYIMCTGLLLLWTCRGCQKAPSLALQSVCWWWWVRWVNNATGPLFFPSPPLIALQRCVCLCMREPLGFVWE